MGKWVAGHELFMCDVVAARRSVQRQSRNSLEILKTSENPISAHDFNGMTAFGFQFVRSYLLNIGNIILVICSRINAGILPYE